MNVLERAREAKKQTEARLERSSGGSTSSLVWWKPSNGDNRVRIMPPWSEKEDYAGLFFREAAQHWNVAEEQRGPVLCPKRTPDLEDIGCPICEFLDQLKQTKKGDPEAQLLMSEMRPKTVYFLNIIDMTDPEYTAADQAEWQKKNPEAEPPFSVGDSKIQVYACPTTIFDQIVGLMTTNKQDITDLKTGRNIVITKHPNKDRKKTRYTCQPELNETEVELSAETTLPHLETIGFKMSRDELIGLLSNGPATKFAVALPGGKSNGSLSSSTETSSEDDSEPGDEAGSIDDAERAMREALGK